MLKQFRIFFCTAIILSIIFTPVISSSQTSSIQTLILNKESLEKIRNAYLNNDAGQKPLIKKFLADADIIINAKLHSVMEKLVTPPDGDKHDFMSLGPYWWPDPAKKDGLPYIRKDGERNPEYYKIPDQEYFSRMAIDTKSLAVAFFITNNSKYAIKAVKMIRVWFLDDSTRMNPNMKHAQFIPGINTGRGIGLIETREIYMVLDAIGILRSTKEWRGELDQKMKQWLEEYFNWVTTHQYGIDESNEKNNHGTWLDVQVSSIALFLGKNEFAKKIFEDAKEKRIGSQIEPDGKQPLELARTKSWSYSCMNLSAFMHLAILAEHVNVDLWNYQSPHGGSIRKALDYLLPFTKDFNKWEYKQIEKFGKENLVTLISLAEKKYDSKIYSVWLKKILNDKIEISFNDLLY
jgi:hypothetical protein